MHDPRLELFLRSWAGLGVMAGLVFWLWECGGVRAERLFGTRRSDLATLARVTWACVVLTLAAMALGSFGILHPVAWAVLTIVGGFCLRGTRHVTLPERALASESVDDRVPPASLAFVVIALTLVVGRALYGLRNPPADVDSILYHLPMVAHWTVTGGLDAARFEPQMIGSFFPGNVEILALWFSGLLGRETLMTLPGVLSLGLLALALRRLAIEAGAHRAVAEVLALALACAPGVLQLTLGLRVENIFATWFAVSLLFALRARQNGSRGDTEAALCAVGLLAGCKSTGPLLAAMVLPMIFVQAPLRARLMAVLGARFGLVALLVTGGFWLARNTVAAGNPVYPANFSVGPWALPGFADHAEIVRTSQWAMWRAGLTGHLTLTNIMRYFGPIALILAPGGIGAMILLVRPGRMRERRVVAALLAATVLATSAMTILQPYSGANAPEFPGGPLTLSSENIRYTMPTLVALLPLAAVGLSALPVSLVVLVAAVLAVSSMLTRAGHMLPAFAMVVGLATMYAWRPRWVPRSRLARWTQAGLACAAVALAVTAVEPGREATTDHVWDTFMQKFDNLPSSVVRDLRERSGGRPIACAGLMSVWAFYGRELNGRPEYVPVGTTLATTRDLWRFAPDSRAQPDAALWMRNLKASGAPFVVLVTGKCLIPVERTWCERDPAHFEPVYITADRAVYRVTGM